MLFLSETARPAIDVVDETAVHSVVGEESEADYVERKTKEYLAKRNKNHRKFHFDYRRRR